MSMQTGRETLTGLGLQCKIYLPGGVPVANTLARALRPWTGILPESTPALARSGPSLLCSPLPLFRSSKEMSCRHTQPLKSLALTTT